MDTRETKAVTLIPCYNAAPHLEQCLESAIAQGYPVILCDDASVDKSLDIAKRYPIEIIANATNMGVGVTRQKLVEYAQYKYRPEFVQMFDADDFFLTTNKIANQIKLIQANASDVAIDPIAAVYIDESRRKIKFNADLLSEALKNRIIHLNACLFRLTAMPAFSKARCCNDALFMLDMIKRGLRVVVEEGTEPTSIYRYSWGGDQITANYHREKENLSILFNREIQQLAWTSKIQLLDLSRRYKDRCQET